MSETTAPERDERSARSDRTAFVAMLARLTLIGALAVAVPLAMSSLTTAEFALYVLVTQLAPLLVFADLGIGNGIISLLPERLARGGVHATRLVSSALALVLTISVAGSAVLLLTLPWAPWSAWLGVVGLDAATVGASVAAFGTCFMLGIPLSLTEKVALATQSAVPYYAWQCIGGVIIALGTLAAHLTDAGVAWFVLAVAGGPVMANLCAAAWFRAHGLHVQVSVREVSRAEMRQVASFGLSFFALGVAGAAAYETALLVVSHVLSDADLAAYFVAMRIATVPTMLVGVSYVPLWPAVADALARADSRWIWSEVRRIAGRGIAISFVAAAAYVAFGPAIANLWTSEPTATPRWLYAAFGVWIVLCGMTGPLAMLLNGAKVIRLQVVCACLTAVVTIPLAVAMTDRFGITGPIVAMILAQLSCVTLPALVVARRRSWV